MTITSGITANNKMYDGTTAATISFEQCGIERGGGRGRGEREAFDQRIQGQLYQPERGYGIVVTVSGLTLTGAERDQLHAGAAGGIECEHHGGGSDDHIGDHRQQQDL